MRQHELALVLVLLLAFEVPDGLSQCGSRRRRSSSPPPPAPSPSPWVAVSPPPAQPPPPPPPSSPPPSTRRSGAQLVALGGSITENSAYLGAFDVCYPVDSRSQAHVSNGQLTLSSFGGSANDGDIGVLLIATYYSDENAAGDAPLFRDIAAALQQEFPGRVHALVSLKGSTSCDSWSSTYLSGAEADPVTVLDDSNSVLHYALFDANPQYVVVDKAMRVRSRFTDVEDLDLDRIRGLVVELLSESPRADQAGLQPVQEPEPELEPEPECVEPSSESDCRAAALASGYALGSGGWSFAGPYSTNGCYVHTSGTFEDAAFWSTGSHTPSGTKARVCMPVAPAASAISLNQGLFKVGSSARARGAVSKVIMLLAAMAVSSL